MKGRAETTYRLTIREDDDGWHWRVEVDVRNGRAWSGVVESYEYAVMTAARRMQSAIRSDQREAARTEIRVYGGEVRAIQDELKRALLRSPGTVR